MKPKVKQQPTSSCPRSIPPLDTALVRSTLHDVNNLLTAITLDAELLARRVPESDPLAADILAAARHAARLCECLLVGKPSPQPHTHCMDDIVGEIVRLTPELPPLVLDLAVPLPPHVDVLRLQQALANLISNGATAMRGRSGSLRIKTELHDLATPTSDTLGNVLSAGRYWVMVVSDAGRGLSRREIRKIFQPGYSTREQAVAAGFGLLAVTEAALRHAGGVFVESIIGEGSRFGLWLPAG